MKYRRLHQEELAELEQVFIQFLAANAVTGSDWEKLKQEDTERAEQLINLFSDMIFAQTLEKVNYLEFKTSKDIKTFHCLEDKISMNGLLIEGDTGLDFTENLSPAEMMTRLQASGANLKLYSAEKPYSRQRELELFDMMEQGAKISPDGALYKTLESLKSKK